MIGSNREPRARRWLIASGIAVLLFAGALLTDRREAFIAYLIAWLFTLGISLGAMVMRMVHVLTGGRWGEAIRPALVTLTAALPLSALLVIPLFFGMHDLFVWSHRDAVAASEILQKKSGYLNVPFFMLRTVVALSLWSLLAWRLVALDEPLEHADEERHTRLRSTSIIGLIVYTFSVTWFSVDWVMSLVPEWKSTGFGLLFALGQTLAGFAAALTASTWALRAEQAGTAPQTLNDLGNITLTLVLLWTYLAFMQYLIVWIGDQPHDTAWYLPRVQTSWKALAIVIVVAHFAVPLLVLLFRRAKRNTTATAALGAALLLAHWFDVLWLVAPSMRRSGFALHWADVVATVALLALLRSYILARGARHGPDRHRAHWHEAHDHG